MSASADLRARTHDRHEEVDAAFAGFALDTADGYRRFLIAHARALPAAEAALAAVPGLPHGPWRAPMLAHDLADLGEAMPAVLPFATASGAAGWGALYVVEGSRLGGVMVARDVAPTLPHRYLDAGFASGEWRALRAAIDAEAGRHDARWLDDAVAGAAACFTLYRRAADAA